MATKETATEEYVSLATLGRGAAVELFDDELQRMLANILDPNTSPDTVRSVTLTVKVKPDESREHGRVILEVKSKLASPKGVGTVLFFGKENGRAIALERNPRQPDLPLGNVANISEREKK